MDLRRVFKHLLLPPWLMRRTFTPGVLQRIEAAIAAGERSHRGELCVVIEAALDLMPLLRGQAPRIRAREVFARQGVWDTAENNGVLLYVNWADHDIEIVVDRGIAACVEAGTWEAICQRIETAFRDGRYESGLLAGIEEMTALLILHFPEGNADNPDELVNRPLLL